MKTTFLPFVLGFGLMHASFAQTVVTSPPPAQLVFVPNPSAVSISKHPTRPALYLGCYATAEAKNLITYRLNADGSLIPESKKECENYFTVNTTNAAVNYNYRVYRPSVLEEQNILYVIAGAADPVNCFASTNNNEIAALALDEQGLPTKVLKAFRTNYSGTQYLVGVRCDPTSHRLYLTYWGALGWCALNGDGLPASTQCAMITYAGTCWYWDYVPEWNRFYATYSGLSLRIFSLASDGLITDFLQGSTLVYGDSACLEVSTKFRKLYNLDLSQPGIPRLVVCSLTKDGRLTSVPRYFSLPDADGVRFDFTANKLYAWTAGTVWKTYTLDADGYPRGEPQVSVLGCGAIPDVFVDEKTGKVYVACTQPPTPAK